MYEQRFCVFTVYYSYKLRFATTHKSSVAKRRPTLPQAGQTNNNANKMTKSNLALMLKWTSPGPDSPINQVQVAVFTSFLFPFFLLIILVEILSSILADRQNSKNQSYLLKNNSKTFCELVCRFYKITVKSRPTLPWKRWPNKQ